MLALATHMTSVGCWGQRGGRGERVGVSVGQVVAQATCPHKYQHEPLEAVLKQHLGHDIVLRSEQPKVAVVAVEWSVTPRQSVLLRSYEQPFAPGCTTLPGHPTREVLLWEAARATTAAPTYFSPFQIDKKWFVDGGLTAHDPSVAALAEAAALFPHGLDDVNMFVSLGSGMRAAQTVAVDPDPWLWNLANDVVTTCIQSKMNRLAAHAALGNRYCRLEGTIAKDTMDDAVLMEAWIEAAQEYVDSPAVAESIHIMVARLLSAT
eukprot:m.688463 g.688463  ORF g.688463 m.688463 type:complete len:264 (+) comp22845_c0_seq43:1460-2251(+)